jgi:ParB family chromosome partitioning protein
MDNDALEELAESIKDHGVLQPIRVRSKPDGGYEIIAGERRWTAATRAGLRDIPAVVVTADDDQAYVEALIENIQREDLNPVDRAHALTRLRVALGRQSWEEVGKVLGIGRQHVHRLLNVTKLPEPIQEDIRVGDLTEKHGRALLTLRAYPQQQMVLWERISEESLTGDAAVAAAKELRPGATPVRKATQPDSATLTSAVDSLLTLLGDAPPADIRASREQLTELRIRIDEAVALALADAAPHQASADG